MMIHCDCGMCEHGSTEECVETECRCCANFHMRSGNEKVRAAPMVCLVRAR